MNDHLNTCLAAAVLASGLSAQDGDAWSWSLFEDMKVEVKALDTKDGSSTLGAAYAIDHVFRSWDLGGDDWDEEQLGRLRFTSSGSFAFERASNPENLVESRLRLDYRSKTFEKDDRGTRGLTWGGSALLGIDTDQRFADEQLVYGVEVFYVNRYNPKSGLWWNVFDYPGALLRALLGDDGNPVGGEALPALAVSLEQVHPSGDDPRAMVGDDSDFARLHAAVSWSTRAFALADTEETEDGQTRSRPTLFAPGDYNLKVAARYYHELNADAPVKDADLDAFAFLQVGLEATNGMFIRYTTGQLPFDAGSDESLQVGWSSNL